MNLHKKIDDNTTLYYVESDCIEYAKDKECVLTYTLSFQFYDCQYFVQVTKKDIQEDNNFGCLISGDSKLYDSFESACEEDHWDLIKQSCNDFDIWHKNLNV